MEDNLLQIGATIDGIRVKERSTSLKSIQKLSNNYKEVVNSYYSL